MMVRREKYLWTALGLSMTGNLLAAVVLLAQALSGPPAPEYEYLKVNRSWYKHVLSLPVRVDKETGDTWVFYHYGWKYAGKPGPAVLEKEEKVE